MEPGRALEFVRWFRSMPGKVCTQVAHELQYVDSAQRCCTPLQLVRPVRPSPRSGRRMVISGAWSCGVPYIYIQGLHPCGLGIMGSQSGISVRGCGFDTSSSSPSPESSWFDLSSPDGAPSPWEQHSLSSEARGDGALEPPSPMHSFKPVVCPRHTGAAILYVRAVARHGISKP